MERACTLSGGNNDVVIQRKHSKKTAGRGKYKGKISIFAEDMLHSAIRKQAFIALVCNIFA